MHDLRAKKEARQEVELALIPRNMNQLMMNTFLTIDKKYN